MALFPFLAAPIKQPQSLPLLEEWAFDFSAGCLLMTDGQMHKVTGLEALKVWIYKALLTARGRFAAYSATFGSDLEALVGSEFSPAAARSEAKRMVTEALLVSPYVSAVSSVEVALEGSLLAVKCAVATVYGSADLEVTV